MICLGKKGSLKTTYYFFSLTLFLINAKFAFIKMMDIVRIKVNMSSQEYDLLFIPATALTYSLASGLLIPSLLLILPCRIKSNQITQLS